MLLLAPACSFDGSSTYLDEDEPKVGEPVGGGSTSDVPDPARIYLASGESTTDGEIVSGSFLDAATHDGTAEVIRAEVQSEVEKLKHKWKFAAVPAGLYELTLVAHPYSPIDVEYFTVDYKLAGARERTQILLMPAGDSMTSFSGPVDLVVQADVEIRAWLVDEAGVLDDPPSGPGQGMGSGGGGNDKGEEAAAYRALGVDYIALTQIVHISK